MKHMKIIFLDIDGVMNSEVYHKTLDTKKKNWRRFDPDAVKIIKRIVEEYHNGKIFINYSEISKGTSFRIVLPKNI